MATGDDKFDGLYMTVAQQAGGIDPLFDSFFGFLRRKTDYFSGAGDGSKAEATMRAAFGKHRKIFEAEAAEKEAREAKRRAEEEARKKRIEKEKAKAGVASAPPQRFEEVVDEPAKREPASEGAPDAAGAPAGEEEEEGKGASERSRSTARSAPPLAPGAPRAQRVALTHAPLAPAVARPPPAAARLPAQSPSTTAASPTGTAGRRRWAT